jgi:hypothetical protein
LISPFNSPLETGVRALAILVAVHPLRCDLQRLVEFDYLVVHSADADGPSSLHVALPFRTGELLVRREIVERGLMLMRSRNLVVLSASAGGLEYYASEEAGPFLAALQAPYIQKLMQRASWAAEAFANASKGQRSLLTKQLYQKWTAQFQQPEVPGGLL